MAARPLALFACAVLAAACSGGARIERSYPAPTAASILAELAARRARATSFMHVGGTMEFWSGEHDRIVTPVDVMGAIGAKVRLQAQDPGGGMTMADLACDGSRFAFVDRQHDCQLTGPCNEDSIASLLRVRMTPDELVLIALGQPPILPGALRGTVSWDAARGAERVDLVAADGRTEQLVLDGRSGARWDVLDARVSTAAGKLDWILEQEDFVDLRGPAGETLRAGRKIRFRQPATGGDLDVKWADRKLNPALADDKFRLDIPAGLEECGKPRPARVTPAPLPQPARVTPAPLPPAR